VDKRARAHTEENNNQEMLERNSDAEDSDGEELWLQVGRV